MLLAGGAGDWSPWNKVVYSTVVWLFALFVGFMLTVFIVAFTASLGAQLATATAVGAWFYGIVGCLWTIAAIFLRSRLARRWDLPLKPFPLVSVRQKRRLGRRHGIRRGAEPAAVVLSWIAGGGLMLALLATPFYLRADGPAPSAVLIATRTVFIVMLLMLTVAVLWLGPAFARAGQLEYGRALDRELAVLEERSLVSSEEASRLTQLNDYLTRVRAKEWDAALMELELFRDTASRGAVASQTFFAFVGAVMGTALGFLVALIN